MQNLTDLKQYCHNLTNGETVNLCKETNELQKLQ